MHSLLPLIFFNCVDIQISQSPSEHVFKADGDSAGQTVWEQFNLRNSSDGASNYNFFHMIDLYTF